MEAAIRTAPTTRVAPSGDSWLIALAAGAVYLLLGQETLYGDAKALLQAAWLGELRHEKHLAYYPMLAALRALLGPLGFSLYQTARLFSTLGAAIGVGLTHRAFRVLGFGRAEAGLATGLVAATPSLVFFATMVELHGPFFAWAGLAFVATARLVVCPGPGRAAALGIATTLAYAAHATGNLLPGALGLVFLAAVRAPGSPWRLPWRRALALCAITAATHLALMLALLWTARRLGFAVSAGSQIAQILEFGAIFGGQPLNVFVSAWYDWLAPCAPLSVAWLAGCHRPALRPLAAALAVTLVPYVVMTFVLCGPNPEHGAYQLPLLWPAAWLTVRALPRRATVALLAIAALLAVGKVAAHDDPERSLEYAAGLRQLAGDHGFLVLVGDERDLEAMFVRFPDRDVFFNLLRHVQVRPELQQQGLDMLERYLREQLAAGKRVFLTGELERVLTHPAAVERYPFGKRMLDFLGERFALQPVHARGFSGEQVMAR